MSTVEVPSVPEIELSAEEQAIVNEAAAATASSITGAPVRTREGHALTKLYETALSNPIIARELARAGNYNNYANNVSVDGVQMQANDVHYEFISVLKAFAPVLGEGDAFEMMGTLIESRLHNVWYMDNSGRLNSRNNFDPSLFNDVKPYTKECETELNFALLYKCVEDALMKRKDCDEDCDPLPAEEIDCPTGLETLFVDDAYEHVWFWDDVKKVYYKLENGGRVEYEDLQSNVKNCYQTYLKGNVEECKTIAACLLDGDGSSLARCLSTLGNLANLFNVSVKEISQTPPHVVRRLMRKLGIKVYTTTDDNGSNYNLPEPYDHWKEAGGKQYEAILNSENTSFGNYVKGLIHVVVMNPAIINNKNPVLKSQKLSPAYTSRYGESVGIRRFDLPQLASPKAKVHNVITREQLDTLSSYYNNRGMPNLSYMPQNAVVTAVEQGSLMSYGGAVNTKLKDGSGTFFESIYNNLKQGLKSTGVSINSNDADKIDNAIKRIQTYEAQLAEIYKRLAVALQMGSAFGVDALSTDGSVSSEMSSDNMRSIDDVRAFMEGHIKKLRSSYKQMYEGSGLLSSHLLNVFGKIAVKCCDDEKKEEAPAPAPAAPIVYKNLEETEC